MKFSKNNVHLICAVVVINFAVYSNAAISSLLSAAAEAEKLFTSEQYQAVEDAIIMNTPYKESRAAKAAIESIRKEASRLEGADESKQAILPIMDSIITGIRIISQVERIAYKNFDEALKLSATDPKEAFQNLRNSTKSTEYIMYSFGIPLEDTFGEILAQTGGAFHAQIKKCMSYIQFAGTAFLDAVRIAGEIGAMGIEAGGKATEIGLNAAHETIASGGAACFKYSYQGAKELIDDVLSSPSIPNAITETNRIQQIIDTFKTNVSTSDSAALAAIDSLNSIQKTFLAEPKSQAVKDASNIVIQGYSSSISEIADAMKVATNSLKEARQLNAEYKDAAVNIIQKGIQNATDEMIHACSIVFVSTGAAKQVAHGITNDQLIKIMIELIVGRVAVNYDLRNAEAVALIGVRSGANDLGIDAAIKICEAAGNALYTQFVECGNMALDVLRSL